MFTPIKNIPLKWQKEIDATAFKYNLLIIKIGMFLNLFIALGDYLNSPQHFTSFLILRTINCLVMLILIINKRHFINIPGVIAFIPFLGISLQNAYMYSVLTDVCIL